MSQKMDPLDLQNLINRMRSDLALDGDVQISVDDLSYMLPLVNWLDTLQREDSERWWAISEEGGIALSGDRERVEEFCAKYSQYRPQRVGMSRWSGPTISDPGPSPWEARYGS